MSHEIYDVQAALLYSAMPNIDVTRLVARLNAQCAQHDLPGEMKILPGLTNDREFAFGGCGVHVMMTTRDEPLQQEAFKLQLSAPIRKLKSYDFEGIIRSHGGAVVINVGDGDVPIPLEARRMMAEMGAGGGADPMVKLTVLHLLIQAVAEQANPLMTDFLPSQSLLSPQELEAVKDMGLPVPILFHPYPVDGGKTADGQTRFGMQAIHSQHLIGKVLELEAVPEGVDFATMINLLSSLIMENRIGTLPLDHGDVLQESEGLAIYIRHEAPNADGEPMRIVASFDTPAKGPAPKAPAPTPTQDAPGAAAGFAQDGERDEFQDRIARLMAKADALTDGQLDRHQPLPEQPAGGVPSEPRQGFLASLDFPVSRSTLKIGGAALLFALLYFVNPGAIIGDRIESQFRAEQENFGMLLGAVSQPLDSTPGKDRTMNTLQIRPANQDVAKRAKQRETGFNATPASTVTQPTASNSASQSGQADAPKGRLIVSGRDASGNAVIYQRELSGDEDRDTVVREVMTGTLRSVLTSPSD